MNDSEMPSANELDALPPLVKDAITFIKPAPLEQAYLLAVVQDEKDGGRSADSTRGRIDAAMKLRESITPGDPNSVDSYYRVAGLDMAFREMQRLAMDMSLQRAPNRAQALSKFGENLIDTKVAEYKQIMADAYTS